MSRHPSAMTPEYLGAYIEAEPRLVLVEMDPKKPWEAFRKMRSLMRDTNAHASVDVFAPRANLEQDAKVIPLRRRLD